MKQTLKTKKKEEQKSFKPKKIYSLVFIAVMLFASFTGNTQAVRKDSLLRDTSTVIEERLVALALQGPLFKSAESQNKINEYQLKAAKNAWLNLLTISVNYNDQTFAKTTTAAYVYPKYFFGFTLPLGTMFSSIPVKSAKEQIKINTNNQEQLAREVKAEVISKYHQYKNYSALIGLQNEVVEDYHAALMQAEEKFRASEISIEVYSAASKNYNEEMSKKLTLQLEQDLVRIDIERIIGTDLKSVTH